MKKHQTMEKSIKKNELFFFHVTVQRSYNLTYFNKLKVPLNIDQNNLKGRDSPGEKGTMNTIVQVVGNQISFVHLCASSPIHQLIINHLRIYYI